MKGLVFRIFLLILLLFTSWASVLNAQEMKDVMKERLRESLKMPEMTPLQHNPFIIEQPKREGEVLRISPTTRLPTKYDRILNLPKQEVMTIRMQIIPTNAPPINMRQIGSAEIVLISKPSRIHNNGVIHPAPKMLVRPSGKSFDPSYGRAERRRIRTDRLVKAYNNER